MGKQPPPDADEYTTTAPPKVTKAAISKKAKVKT